jgi:hypothetical protein
MLFDPDSAIAIDAGIVSYVAAGFGNIGWLVGILFLFISVLLGIVVFDDDGMRKKVIKQRNTEVSRRLHNVNLSFSILFVNMLSAVLMLGVGYWWTGSMWVVLIAMTFVYQAVYLETATDLENAK